MKQIFRYFTIALTALTAVSCNQDMEYNPGGVSGVQHLYAPDNSYYVELASGNGQYVDFTWEGSNAEDGGAPLYEVVFYSDAAGSQELSRINAGAANSLSIAHKDINKVMNLAGVEPDSEGAVYWSVVASRGISDAPSRPEPRELVVKRMKGFKIAPENLYLVGSSTETGADISLARQFMALSPGEEYEIFTRLTAGEYNIADGTGADARLFNVTSGIISEDNSDPIAHTNDGVYRIKVDLTSSSVTIDLVENFRLKTCSDYSENALEYRGGGNWGAENIIPNFASDDRYFFRADIGGVDTKIGSTNWDNPSAPADKAEVSWDTQVIVNGDNWGYSYKVIPTYRGEKFKMNATVSLNADLPTYSHTAYFIEL